MKALIAVLALVAALAAVYGLAMIGVIPVAKMAAKSPQTMKLLIAMNLAKPAKSSRAKLIATQTPLVDPLASERGELDAERTQLTLEKAAMQRKADSPPAIATISPKVSAIYDTMAPPDLARLFGKLPDSDVVAALNQMDEEKAGKVLVALPEDRAARLTSIMNRATATGPKNPQLAALSPATSTP